MSKFKIYLVIDILNSEAVHAVKGERDKYYPLRSPLFKTTHPLEIIATLKKEISLKQFYIADLDAIIYKKPNITLIQKILEFQDLEVIIDPGIKNVQHLKLFSNIKLRNIILGLESIQTIQIIKESFNFFDNDKIIVSIDMYKEKLFTNIEKVKNLTPLDIIRKLDKIGIKTIILLDLYRVGQKLGGISPLYLKINREFSGNVLVGGGIKDLDDIKEYYDNNFSGVLVGTSIYDGTIKINELNLFCNSINKNYS